MSRQTQARCWLSAGGVEGCRLQLFSRVKINAITTRARATLTGSHLARSAAGTTLAGLVVDASPRRHRRCLRAAPWSVPAPSPLTLGHTITTATGLQVYGAQLTLTHTVGTATAGTVTTIGAASAGVTTG